MASIQPIKHSRPSLARAFLEHLLLPASMAFVVFWFGTIGFLLMGGGKWTLLECAYMTSITLTTVGYGEILYEFGPNGRIFAMVLMWSGMGVTLYAVSTITGFVVGQKFSKILKELKMEKRIAALKDHYIVCGGGKTGINVIREMLTSNRQCLTIESRPERVEWIRNQFNDDLFLIQGDATKEDVLRRAGIDRAAGILAVLDTDGQNLLITVQARYVNPDIKIVARRHENNLVDKFFRAGANYVVNPSFIGGMRMASEMVRPQVVSFLDRMLRGKDRKVRVEEVTVCAQSPWAGRTIRELDVYRRTGLAPISLKHPDEVDFCYNPSPDDVLRPGTVLIVIGNPDQISHLKSFCSEQQ